MTGRELANLEAVLTLLQQGRAGQARDMLAGVIRDSGGTVPMPPPGGSEPPPAPQPGAMRASA